MSTPFLPASIRFIQRDWLSCNQIVCFDDDARGRHATLIDTGYGKHAGQTLALVTHVLAGNGLPIGALRQIINTHLHSDHCGGNALMARASGAPVHVPLAELETVRQWDESRLTFRGTGQRCERFTAAGAIAPGDWLRLGGLDWQALAAPGHDPHSLILHCAQAQLLIAADALWENGFGIIFPELSGDSGFREQHDVLELIASLPVRTVLPGHGRVFGDVPAALERARQRLAALRADPRRNARNSIKALL
ncbi:MAG TPA: MBL fold metallo-hydrolase, partial [Burkholderiaceae bacterium]|nr:MBL fold metallo-hydrolase [Burkholderiaceae bacterium]